MKTKIILFALLAGALAFFYLRVTQGRVEYSLVMVDKVPVRVEIADTIGKQYKGLGGRDSLPETHGMLFPFGLSDRYGFTMRGMRFPIDILWIRDGRIVDISHDLPAPKDGESPLTVLPKEPVNAVLEVNAGWTVRNKISPGETVRVVE